MKRRGIIDSDLIKKAARLGKNESFDNSKYREAYDLHAQARRTYPRLTIDVERRNEQWSMDLGEMNDLARFNKNFKYLLVCVDVYSRYAFVKLLKNKTANNVGNKFEGILLDSG